MSDTECGEEKEIFYKTSDIHFSGFLGALDIPLVNTEKEKTGDNRFKVVFVFKVPANALRQLKTQYFGGKGTVKALRFVEQLRSLKSMCFV